MKKVKIAQITDTHITSSRDIEYRGISSHKNLELVIQDINQRHPDIDLLLHTGDVVEQPQLKSYENFFAIIGDLKQKLVWLPGNHDDFDLMKKIFPSSITPQSISLGSWKIGLLNSQLNRQIPGAIDDQSLEWLFNLLKTEKDFYLLLATHHHPFKVNGHMDKYPLQNTEVLLNIIGNDPRVRLMINGHIHQSFYYQFKNVTFISSPATSMQIQSCSDKFAPANMGPAYQIIELEDSGNFSTHIHICNH